MVKIRIPASFTLILGALLHQASNTAAEDNELCTSIPTSVQEFAGIGFATSTACTEHTSLCYKVDCAYCQTKLTPMSAGYPKCSLFTQPVQDSQVQESVEQLTDETTTPEPVSQEPATSEPVTSEPATPEPVTPEPLIAVPETPEPVTPEPATPEPLVAVPETPEPVTPEPTTPEPLIAVPETPEPVTPEPVTPEPVTAEPVTPEPVTPEPVTPEPVTRKPVTPEPVTQEPTTPEPLIAVPETPEPVTPEPATPEPVAPEPLIAVPETFEPVTPEPATPEPVIAAPPTCTNTVSVGDAAVGINLVTDVRCAFGGLGCADDVCRYCKTSTTPQSGHLLSCDDITNDPDSTSVAPTVTPSSSSTPICSATAAPGDKAVGVDIITDLTCHDGGVGCLGAICRFCKRFESAQSSYMLSCATIEAWTPAPSTVAPETLEPTTENIETSAPDSGCAATLSQGDKTVGIWAVSDSTCENGGLGCFTDSCRFCRTRDTPQSTHLLICDNITAAQVETNTESTAFASAPEQNAGGWQVGLVVAFGSVAAVAALAFVAKNVHANQRNIDLTTPNAVARPRSLIVDI